MGIFFGSAVDNRSNLQRDKQCNLPSRSPTRALVRVPSTPIHLPRAGTSTRASPYHGLKEVEACYRQHPPISSFGVRMPCGGYFRGAARGPSASCRDGPKSQGSCAAFLRDHLRSPSSCGLLPWWPQALGLTLPATAAFRRLFPLDQRRRCAALPATMSNPAPYSCPRAAQCTRKSAV